MKRILFRADDIGYSRGVTLGIIEAHKKGIVKSAAFMINMPNVLEASELVKDCPDLCLGLHINVTNGKALAPKELISNLVDDNGTFLSSKIRRQQIKDGVKLFDEQQVYIEAKHQMEYYIKVIGKKPEYVDVHVLEVAEMINVAKRISEEYEIKQCYYNLGLNELQLQQTMRQYHYYQNHHDHFEKYFEEEFDFSNDFNLIVTHPAYIDYDLKTSSSMINERLYDFALLTSKEVKDYLDRNNIEIISFRDL